MQDEAKPMNKQVKIEKKVKHLGITMTNMHCMLFQNNYCILRHGMKLKNMLSWDKVTKI